MLSKCAQFCEQKPRADCRIAVVRQEELPKINRQPSQGSLSYFNRSNKNSQAVRQHNCNSPSFDSAPKQVCRSTNQTRRLAREGGADSTNRLSMKIFSSHFSFSSDFFAFVWTFSNVRQKKGVQYYFLRRSVDIEPREISESLNTRAAWKVFVEKCSPL
jgi:hypothetical protein